MSGRRVNRILCAANPRGSAEAIEQMLATAGERRVDAVTLAGNIGDHDGRWDVLRALGRAQLPVYWVPGPGDAPVDRYLRDAFNIEIAFPLLHGVHGTIAYASGGVLVAGLGGEISDDPEEPREEQTHLRYPRWEVEYRLKVLQEVTKYNQLVLLFTTPPAHKRLSSGGSEVVAELVNTYHPRLVVCAGERGVEIIGTSLTVAPGDLGDGHYAIADLHTKAAELEELAGVTR
jgi:Icc-related predicted phosphoesterase